MFQLLDRMHFEGRRHTELMRQGQEIFKQAALQGGNNQQQRIGVSDP